MNRIIALGLTTLLTASLVLGQGNPQRRNEQQQQAPQAQRTEPG